MSLKRLALRSHICLRYHSISQTISHSLQNVLLSATSPAQCCLFSTMSYHDDNRLIFELQANYMFYFQLSLAWGLLRASEILTNTEVVTKGLDIAMINMIMLFLKDYKLWDCELEK